LKSFEEGGDDQKIKIDNKIINNVLMHKPKNVVFVNATDQDASSSNDDDSTHNADDYEHNDTNAEPEDFNINPSDLLSLSPVVEKKHFASIQGVM
jgi:hypothetical protein